MLRSSFLPCLFVLKAERWCLAKLLRVLYKAFPDTAFVGLTAVGSIDAVSLVASSKAVLVRAATKTLSGWQDSYLALRSTAEDHLPFTTVLG